MTSSKEEFLQAELEKHAAALENYFLSLIENQVVGVTENVHSCYFVIDQLPPEVGLRLRNFYVGRIFCIIPNNRFEKWNIGIPKRDIEKVILHRSNPTLGNLLYQHRRDTRIAEIKESMEKIKRTIDWDTRNHSNTIDILKSLQL